MTKSQPWLSLSRPYGKTLQTPSTAHYTTEKGILSLGESETPFTLNPHDSAPDYIDLIIKLVPLPHLNNPLISCDSAQQSVYSQELESYQYRGVQLQTTDKARIQGQFVSLKGRNLRFSQQYQPQKIQPKVECNENNQLLVENYVYILYEFCYDSIQNDINFSKNQGSGLFAVGGPFVPGMDLHHYVQYFVRFYEENSSIYHHLTSLNHWWEKGLFLPLHNSLPELEIVNTHQSTPYLSLLDTLRQGHAAFAMVNGVDENGLEILSFYQSIDAQRHGLDHALITFKETKNVQ